MKKFLDEFVADTNRQAEEIDKKYANQRAKLLQLKKKKSNKSVTSAEAFYRMYNNLIFK